MSLVVVKKDGHQVCIVSDTQLTYPDQESRRHKNSPGDGGLKTIVLSENLAVSFAGDIKFVELALQSIGEIRELQTVLAILNDFHLKSSQHTEFILTKGYPESSPIIYKISRGACSEEESAWLGDYEAFNLFQSYFLNRPFTQNTSKNKSNTHKPSSTEPIFRNFKMSIERNVESSVFSKASSAMDWVIDQRISPSVGGFKVLVVFDKSFRYVSYSRSFNERLEFNSLNQFKFHASAQHGGYSVIFHGASSDYNKVALYILQGELGIVYERSGFGLHVPKIMSITEVEFHNYLAKNCGILAVFPNSNRSEVHFPEAYEAYQSRDYMKALDLFNKAIPNNHGKIKAAMLFNRGIVHLHLNQHAPAMISFGEALNLDPKIYFGFRKALNEWRKDFDNSFRCS